MAFHVKDDFKAGAPVSQVPASWYNLVAKFLNNMVGGRGITVRKSADGQCVIDQEMEIEDEDSTLANSMPFAVAAYDSDETAAAARARAGASRFVSRADHVHMLPDTVVTTDTQQTISAAKTFLDNISLTGAGKGILLRTGAGTDFVLRGLSGTSDGVALYRGSASDRVFSAGDGAVNVGGGAFTSVKLGDASSTAIYLGVAPTDTNSTSSTNIATLGWTNTNFWRKDSTATGVLYASGGAISYKGIGTVSGTVAAGDHTHDLLYASLSHSHGNITSSGTLTGCTSNDCFLITTAGGVITHSNSQPTVTDVKAMAQKWGQNGDKFVADHTDITDWATATASFLTLADLTDYVTKNTTQTITGVKTFHEGITVASSSVANKSVLNRGSIELYHATPYIDFHYDHSTDDYTARIIEAASGVLEIKSPNHARLQEHPTDTTDNVSSSTGNARQIATLGWTNSHFWRKDSSETGVLYASGGSLSYMTIGTASGTVAAGDHTHSNYALSADLDAITTTVTVSGQTVKKVPFSALDGTGTHSGQTCFVTVDSNGKIGCLGKSGKEVLWLNDAITREVNNVAAKKLLTDVDAATDLTYVDASFPSISTDSNGDMDIGTTSVTDVDGAIGELASSVDTLADFLSDWAAVDIPDGTQTDDKLLMCAAGGTALSFASVQASNPGNAKTVLVAGNATADTAQGTAHTVGDGNGFVIPSVTRVVWTGTKLYRFYVNMTFDKYGRLYNVTAENREEIDTPATINWS